MWLHTPCLIKGSGLVGVSPRQMSAFSLLYIIFWELCTGLSWLLRLQYLIVKLNPWNNTWCAFNNQSSISQIKSIKLDYYCYCHRLEHTLRVTYILKPSSGKTQILSVIFSPPSGWAPAPGTSFFWYPSYHFAWHHEFMTSWVHDIMISPV